MPSVISKSESIGLKFIVVLLAIFTFGVRTTDAAPCENLASVSLANVTITSAESVASGAFTPPADAPRSDAKYGQLPAFCRVTAKLTPSPDSDIRIEVWMPASGWND